MTVTKVRSLAAQALRAAMRTRAAIGADLDTPVCIWRVSEALGLSVRFAPLTVEGMYIRTGKTPLIIICSERPLVRRVFTAAHEIGHHIFGHGSTLDELIDARSVNEEERLVDLFAGYLLMPPLAVRYAFVQRRLDISTASCLEFYRIASAFGVGYSTLIDHMTYSLRYLDRGRAKVLKQTAPRKIRTEMLGEITRGHLVIVDNVWQLPTIDIEVDDDILFPPNATVLGNCLTVSPVPSGVRARAERPGIAQLKMADQARFIRVARKRYAGLLAYRHLEDPDLSVSREG